MATAYQDLSSMNKNGDKLSSKGKGRLFFMGTPHDSTVRIYAVTQLEKTEWRTGTYPDLTTIGDANAGKINELYYIGAPHTISVSDNSQWLWVTLNRTVAELDAMDRAVDLCQIAWGPEYYAWLTESYKQQGIKLMPEVYPYPYLYP